jgi:hypothetical protein
VQTATYRQRWGSAWPVGRAEVDAGAFRTVGAATGVVGVAAIVLWLITGVRVDEIARYVGYELGFVLVPGWLVYRALVVRPRDRLTELVFSWSLGYFLEVVAFYVTAVTNGRSAFYVYPVVVGVPALLIARRRKPTADEGVAAPPPLPTRSIWIVAGLLVLLLVYAGAVGFTQTPLPRDTALVTYQEDTVFAISLAADALHHWPMTEAPVMGTPLHYHLFTFMHMAAISEVTGIDLSVVVMRLYQVPLLLLLALQLLLAGRTIGRRWSTGLAALALVLFFGELDLATGSGLGRFPFRGMFFYWLLSSHSFLFGLVFFVPTIVLLSELLQRKRVHDSGRRYEWVLFAALLVGCVGSKSYSPLVLGGALVLFLCWELVRRRGISVQAGAALALVGVVYIAANVIAFAWNAAGAQVKPFRNLDTTAGVEGLNTYFGHLWGTTMVPRVLGVPYGLFGLLGIPLVGVALLLRYRRLALSEAEAFFLCLFIAVLPVLLVSDQPGFGQMFLVFFGVVPGVVLAAEGYVLFLAREARRSVRRGVPFAAAAAAVIIVIGVLLGVGGRIGLELTLFWVFVSIVLALALSRVSRLRALPVGLAIGVVGLVLVETPLLRVLRSAFGASMRFGVGWAAVAVGLVLGLGAIAAAAVLLGRRRGSVRGLVAVAVVSTLLFGVFDTPLDWFPKLIDDATAGKPVYNQEYAGMTTGLFHGLRWIRDHTSPDAVLVVNNHSLYPDGHNSKYFYYSAFAERRIVVESWDYTQRAVKEGDFSRALTDSPFPKRLKLSNAVFYRADLLAMKFLLRGFGARYLVVDKVHGQASPLLAARVGRIYSSGDLDVYEIGKTAPPSPTCPTEESTGVTAVFGQRRNFARAERLWRSVTGVGYRDAVIQQRGCTTYAVVLTDLVSEHQGKQLQSEAAKVHLRVQLECRSHVPQGGLNAVFGHRRSKLAAQKLAGRAQAAGFLGLDVRRDRCGDWEVDLSGLSTAAQRREFRQEAARAGFHVRFEPG